MADFTSIGVSDNHPNDKAKSYTNFSSGSLLAVQNWKQQQKHRRVLMTAKRLALLVLCFAAAVYCSSCTWQMHALNSRLSRLENGTILRQDEQNDELTHHVVLTPPHSSIGSRDHMIMTDVDQMVSTLRAHRLRRHAQLFRHKRPHIKQTANVTRDHLRKSNKLSNYLRFKEHVNKKIKDTSQNVKIINSTITDISKEINKVSEELKRFKYAVFDLNQRQQEINKSLTTIGRGISMTQGDQYLHNPSLSGQNLLYSWVANSKEHLLFKLNPAQGTVTIPYTGRYLVSMHIMLSSDRAQPGDSFHMVEYVMMRSSQALMRCSTSVPSTDVRNEFVCSITSTMKLVANDLLHIVYDGPIPIKTLIKLNVDIYPNQTSWSLTYLGSY